MALSRREGASFSQPQNDSLKEYTDAALKYVHSFLPHHTLLETGRKKKYSTIDSGRTVEQPNIQK